MKVKITTDAKEEGIQVQRFYNVDAIRTEDQTDVENGYWLVLHFSDFQYADQENELYINYDQNYDTIEIFE